MIRFPVSRIENRNKKKLLGCVRAFDRHCNMVLENVREMWTKAGLEDLAKDYAIAKFDSVRKAFSAQLAVDSRKGYGGGSDHLKQTHEETNKKKNKEHKKNKGFKGGLLCKLEGLLDSPLENEWLKILSRATLDFVVGNFRGRVAAFEELMECPNVSRVAFKDAASFTSSYSIQTCIENILNNTEF
ncbi:hypothetical protein RHGRI_002583 [Rhododendron griersonianum]|nr:hypothetical protein RHGRI_002583 [Rhododendron griersonianum]